MSELFKSYEELQTFTKQMSPEEKEEFDKSIADAVDEMMQREFAKNVKIPPLNPTYTYTGDYLYRGINDIRIFGPTPFYSGNLFVVISDMGGVVDGM